MNNVPNQNSEVLQETLAGSTSDTLKTTLRGLRCFKMTLLLLKVLEKLPSHSSVTLSHITESTTNGSVG